MSENFYDILGVGKDANEADIKKAYRSLSLKYHPDRNKEPEAVEKYKKINEAYEILGDNEKKSMYDLELQGGGNPFGFPGHQQPGQADFQDINNMFNMMFSGMGHQMHGMPGGPNIRVFTNSNMPGHQQFHANFFHQIARPETIQKTVQISLEDSYNGLTIPVELNYFEINGNQQENKKDSIYINIPPGIDNNETVEIKDKGNIINGNCGGLKLIIQVNKHPYLQRKGLDLHYTHSISLKEALTGFKIEILHLNGKKIGLNNIENPNIIKPGYVKVAQGYGIKRDTTVGNLIIEFVINFPEELTEEQINQLKTIL